EVCRGLGIPTEGTKMDLIQKIRDFSNKRNHEAEQSENMKKVYNENDDELMETGTKIKIKVKNSHTKTHCSKYKRTRPKIAEETSESPRKMKKCQFQESCFDNRLNSITTQIQDTRQKVEIMMHGSTISLK
ncbi:5137_t:CDS:2, partial [Gigaspora rosea]